MLGVGIEERGVRGKLVFNLGLFGLVNIMETIKIAIMTSTTTKYAIIAGIEVSAPIRVVRAASAAPPMSIHLSLMPDTNSMMTVRIVMMAIQE